MKRGRAKRMTTQLQPTPVLYGKDAEAVIRQAERMPTPEQIKRVRERNRYFKGIRKEGMGMRRKDWHLEGRCLPFICIYKHPADYPDKYVARLWDTDKPTRIMFAADTLEDVRREIPRCMRLRFDRFPSDDPVIIETWM